MAEPNFQVDSGSSPSSVHVCSQDPVLFRWLLSIRPVLSGEDGTVPCQYDQVAATSLGRC